MYTVQQSGAVNSFFFSSSSSLSLLPFIVVLLCRRRTSRVRLEVRAGRVKWVPADRQSGLEVVRKASGNAAEGSQSRPLIEHKRNLTSALLKFEGTQREVSRGLGKED